MELPIIQRVEMHAHRLITDRTCRITRSNRSAWELTLERLTISGVLVWAVAVELTFARVGYPCCPTHSFSQPVQCSAAV